MMNYFPPYDAFLTEEMLQTSCSYIAISMESVLYFLHVPVLTFTADTYHIMYIIVNHPGATKF